MNMEAAGFSQTSVFTGLYGVISQTIPSLVCYIVRWAVHTARGGQISDTYKFVVGKQERKEALWKVGCRVRISVKWTL